MVSGLLTETEIAKLPFRGRGLSRFQAKGPYIDDFIEKWPGETIRILEIGCGFGQLLLDLKIKYGDRVDLYGVSLEEGSVSLDVVSRVARYTKKIGQDYVLDSGISFKFCDAGEHIPFDDNYFDLIVSQEAVVYVHDKANLLREVNRILSANGQALMWTGFEIIGPIDNEVWSTFEIYDNGVLLNIREYLQAFPNVIYKMTEMGAVLKMTKDPTMKMDIRLRNVVDLNSFDESLVGIRSVYDTV